MDSNKATTGLTREYIDELVEELQMCYSSYCIVNEKTKSKHFIMPLLAGTILYHQYNIETGYGINRGFLVLRDTKDILAYNGIYYENVGEILIRDIVQRILGEHSTKARKEEVIGWIKDKADIIIERDMLDNIPNHIYLANGVYDIYKHTIDAFTNEGYPSTYFPIEYDKNAKCDRWLQFLDEVLYEDDIPLIQEMMGYCFYKRYIFQKAFMLVGGGANGKSVLLRVLCKMLGEWNFSTIPLQRIGRDRFTDLDLVGKRANICADLSEKSVEYTGNFKQIVGGDWIRAEKKYAPNGILFLNTAKMIFSANLIPQCKDDSYAYKRRWIVVEFPNVFKDDDPNTDHMLDEKLFREIPGIFNWCMEGLQRLLKNQKFSDHKTLEEVQQYMAEHKDGVLDFVNTCIETGTGKYTKKKVYTQYRVFCEMYDFRVLGPNAFTTKLKQLGPTSLDEYHKKERGWTGINLKPIPKTPETPVEDIENVVDELPEPNGMLDGGLYINGKKVD